MKLGIQAGLGPGHIVLDGDPDPPPQTMTSTVPIQGQGHGASEVPKIALS